MRGSVVSAAAAAALCLCLVPQAQAQPPADSRPPSAPPSVQPSGPSSGEPLPSGWTRSGRELTWTSSAPLPVGDAALEFYAGDRPLGRAVPGRDRRTFRLELHGRPDPVDLTDLHARSAGRRLDARGHRAAPQRRAAPPGRPAATLAAAAVDPGEAGPYETVSGEYTLDDVTLPGLAAPVEMKGLVIAPKGVTGPRPLALFLHGRHDPCYGGSLDPMQPLTWPCPGTSRPVPSYRGYQQAQRLLASQGYDTVSIAANGITAQDGALPDGGAQARSSLVRTHLEEWARWSGVGRAGAPDAVRAAPPADLTRTLLVGHSRGGEGVNRAAMDSLAPPPESQEGYHGPVQWIIRGTVLIAPTAFGQNPAPDVPSVTLLPGCDGDLSDLQGEMYVDALRGLQQGNALHGAVYVEGANHNFFNTEWTPGQAQAPAMDDAANPTDTICAPGLPARLSPARQQTVGATYVAAAAGLFIGGDDRLRPLLDGSGAGAPSAQPVVVHAHAVGGTRTPVVLPDASTVVGGDGARLCAAVTDVNPCISPPDSYRQSPHFAYFGVRSEEGRYAVTAKWSGRGKPVSVKALDATVVSGDELALRVVVPPNTTGTALRVAVTTTAGTRTALGTVTIDGLPGNDLSASYWAQEVRVPLEGVSGTIAGLELTPESDTGQLWLLDAWTWRPGEPAPRFTAAPPRVDLGTLRVDEGDSGTRNYDIPVTVSGTGAGTVRLFLTDTTSGTVTARVVRFEAGQRSISVPIPVAGNASFSYGVSHYLSAKAVADSMVGSFTGSLVVRNDDPLPKITVTPVADHVTEGAALDWQVRLSSAADSQIMFLVEWQPPASTPELPATAVQLAWLQQRGWPRAEPDRSLSSLQIREAMAVQAGALGADLTVPTVQDAVAQPDRWVQFQIWVYQDDGTYASVGTFTGSVRDT